MEKKFYSRPTCKVVTLDMSDIVCQSPTGAASSTDNNVGLGVYGSSSGSNRANNRNDIWGDE